MGAAAIGFDAWCEACQLAQVLPGSPRAGARCMRCGTRLVAAPRFPELWGMLQQLDAVLAAWAGDAVPLATLLPERPVFLTDLTPPDARADDPDALRTQLAALARGDWHAVLAATIDGTRAEPGSPSEVARAEPGVLSEVARANHASLSNVARAGHGVRSDAARAIAHERAGDPTAAIAAWDRVLATGEDERARLARGSLLARARRHAEAAADLRRAGDSFAARWSRAALLVYAATEDPAGALDAGLLARARAEAGEASAFWSDPTVGRLVWSRLVERARIVNDADRARLRAAERELEHDTFWDRALLLVGWVRVGVPEEAARVAASLARDEARALAAEPALTGTPLRDVANAVARTIAAIDAGEPRRARDAIAGALAREDLRRFHLPCAACGRGSIGIDEVREAFPDEG